MTGDRDGRRRAGEQDRAGDCCGACTACEAAGHGRTAAPAGARTGVRATATAVAGTLAAIGGLHALWARSPWPLRDRAQFAELVVGVPPERTPSPALCLGVAGLLGTGAYLVGARGGVLPTTGPRWARAAGSAGVAGVLLARGLAGPVLFGSGRISRTPRFVHLDRRLYSPLCVALGAGAAAVAAGGD